MPVCVCGESYDEGDPAHEFCRFDSSAPGPKTDPAPGPHEAETWPPAAEASPSTMGWSEYASWALATLPPITDLGR